MTDSIPLTNLQLFEMVYPPKDGYYKCPWCKHYNDSPTFIVAHMRWCDHGVVVKVDRT